MVLRNWWLQVVTSIKILVIRLENHHPTNPFPYSVPIIISSIAYWQPLPMQRLKNAAPPTQYWKNEIRISTWAQTRLHRWWMVTQPLRYYTGNLLHVLSLFISLPMITPFLMTFWSNLAACSLHPKIMKLWETALMRLDLSHNSNPKAPHNKKNKKMLNHHPASRAKSWLECHKRKTKIWQQTKFWFVPVVWYSLRFLKKYRQPILELWSAPVPVSETVRFYKSLWLLWGLFQPPCCYVVWIKFFERGP